MGSERLVENYVKAVKNFVLFLGLKDPEAALRKLQSGKMNAAAKVDKFIDYTLEKYAYRTIRGFLFGIKK